MTIRPAHSAEDYCAAKALIIEYVEWLAEEFCSIGFESEIQDLKAVYGPPNGLLLLAILQGAPAGCIAFRTLGEGVCEMKRLYLKPEARGQKLGRKLAEALIGRAREAGYRRMVLDSLPTMRPAQALYRSLGFVEIEPYFDNPIEGVTFMALDLKSG